MAQFQRSNPWMAYVIVMGFWFFQYGDRNNMNDMPYAKVQALTSDAARSTAKRGQYRLLRGNCRARQIRHADWRID